MHDNPGLVVGHSWLRIGFRTGKYIRRTEFNLENRKKCSAWFEAEVGFFNEATGLFSGHALREKGLQKQKGAGPMVSSREQRAAVVPPMNRASTGRQPLVKRIKVLSSSLYGMSFVRTFERTYLTIISGFLNRKKGGYLLGTRWKIASPSARAPQRSAPPCRPRSWFVRVWDSTASIFKSEDRRSLSSKQIEAGGILLIRHLFYGNNYVRFFEQNIRLPKTKNNISHLPFDLGNRGPISIFGPIFKVGDRAEDPDLSRAERTWWPLVEAGRKKKKEGGFFILPTSPKIKDGAFFVLWGRKIEEPPPIFEKPPIFEEVAPPPRLRPIFDPFFGTEDRRWEGSSIFGAEDRKLKIGFFVLRFRRSKMGNYVFDLRLRKSKTVFFRKWKWVLQRWEVRRKWGALRRWRGVLKRWTIQPSIFRPRKTKNSHLRLRSRKIEESSHFRSSESKIERRNSLSP